MMLTRCPACQTAFRVRPEQLRLRQGRVRCGSCGKAFNALATLFDEAQAQADDAAAIPDPQHDQGAVQQMIDEQVLAPHAEAETEAEAGTEEGDQAEAEAHSVQPAAATASSHVFVLEEKAGVELSHDPLTHDPYTPITPDDSADLLIESFQRYRPQTSEPLRFGQIQVDTDPSLGAVAVENGAKTTGDPHILATRKVDPEGGAADVLSDPDEDLSAKIEARQAEDFGASAGKSFDAGATEWPQLPRDEAEDAAEQHEFPPAMPTLLAERQESGDRDADVVAATENTDELPSSDEPLSTMLPDAEEPVDPLAAMPEVDAQDESGTAEESPTFELEPANPPRTWAWGLGIGVLAIALLAQGALLFRQEIIQRLPQTRPLYAQLCAHIGCSMALPREASKIAIESSDLHPEQGAANFFRLRATIRNRASFEQAYPHLELTLTDAADRPLARKVLEPLQWRPADAPAAGFPAGRELEVSVPFETRDVAAVGYRIYVFYP